MCQGIIFYIIERLFEPQNQTQITSIIKNATYKEFNSFIDSIFEEELGKYQIVETPYVILMRDLQYKLLEKNNGSIYKTLSDLLQLEENIAMMALNHHYLKKNIKGHLHLINNCLSQMQEKIEDISILEIKNAMIKIIFKYYLENRRPSSSEITAILKSKELDYSALLGYENLIESESYNQYSLSDYGFPMNEEIKTKILEDKVDKMEAKRYKLYYEIDRKYKKVLKEYVDFEVINYLQIILDQWIIEESKSDSNQDLKIIVKLWKKILYELNENQKNKKVKSDSDQLDIWEYQKRISSQL